MATYYEDDTVKITSTHLSVADHNYELADLEQIRHDGLLRAVRAWTYWLSRGAAVIALLALVPGFVVAIVIAVRLTHTAVDRMTGICVATGVMGALFKGCWDFAIEGYGVDQYGIREIRARWQGDDVVLIRCTDLIRYGSILRALQRAARRAR